MNDYLPVVRMALHIFGALLFIRAVYPKLQNLTVFGGIIRNYQVVPELLVRPITLGLPIAELVVAACLLIPPICSFGAAAAAVLFMVFAAAIAVNLARGRIDIDCGCADESTRQPIRLGMVVRNVSLSVIFAVSASMVSTTPAAAGLLLSAAAAVCAFLLYASYEFLAARSGAERLRLSPAMRRLAWTRYKEQIT